MGARLNSTGPTGLDAKGCPREAMVTRRLRLEQVAATWAERPSRIGQVRRSLGGSYGRSLAVLPPGVCDLGLPLSTAATVIRLNSESKNRGKSVNNRGIITSYSLRTAVLRSFGRLAQW